MVINTYTTTESLHVYTNPMIDWFDYEANSDQLMKIVYAVNNLREHNGLMYDRLNGAHQERADALFAMALPNGGIRVEGISIPAMAEEVVGMHDLQFHLDGWVSFGELEIANTGRINISDNPFRNLDVLDSVIRDHDSTHAEKIVAAFVLW